MSEGTSAGSRPDEAGHVIPFPSPGAPPQVAFQRDELRVIFNLYGRRVAEGEWRDYALDFRRDKAVFSIYRRTSEMPLYRIEKDPKLARRQGAYSVIAASGQILKRGSDLARVIAVLDGPRAV
ncbi:DUF2794 domain-containing protein [Methylobacterium aerolatum]|uniref:DUF2794 domain-containing protein n=1 Tax=Methylobacterium aerolatum TaxID=418708 RepID=A0ABU0I3A1_9HYPH|nr:DUF2794 domain-containing protein [Methylobacterium aerolatum]MDQ0448572.1 hypothetical protein [Methylobacterium aerolatum]GJD33189.1 hypothetical protein FMGBMHLM_0074 [Methylobacterium aerolatum]